MLALRAVTRVSARMIGLAAGTRIWIAAGSDGSAARVHGVERDGADGTRGKSIFWSGVHLSREARRSDQSVVVGWRRAVFVREEIGERKIHLAAGDEWNGVADAGTAVDVARRDRLAPAGAHAELRSWPCKE